MTGSRKGTNSGVQQQNRRSTGRKPGGVDQSVVVADQKWAGDHPGWEKKEGHFIRPPEDPAVQLTIGWWCRGVTKAEIARRLGRTEQVVRRWIDTHPEEVATELREVKAGLFELFAPYAPEAAETTIDVMRHATRYPATRLMAAQAVLDEVFGKPVVRTESKMAAQITVIFEDADATPVVEGKSRPV